MNIFINFIDKTRASIFIICIFGFLLTTISNYPGLMTPDSDFQFIQASSFSFTDWHPPVMSIIWAFLLKIKDGPVVMLVFIGLLYWISFALISVSISTKSKLAASIVVIFAFSPFLINFVGTIWKDVFVFVLFLFGLSVIIFSHFFAVRLSIWIFLTIIFIFVIGALARHNAFFSAMSLSILAFVIRDTRVLKGFYGIVLSTLKGFVLFIIVYLSIFYSIDNLAKPEKKYASSSLFVYDLVGMSIRSNEYLLPKSENFNLKKIEECYEDKGWDKVWVSCPDLIEELNSSGKWAHLSKYWISAVKKYPIFYLKHRIYHFGSFFKTAWLVFNSEPTKTSFDYGFKRTTLYNFMESYITNTASNPVFFIFFTNGFWVVITFLILLHAVCRCFKKCNMDNISLFWISLSGFLYSGPLIFGGVAPDFRYVYWSIGSTLIYLCLLLSHAHLKFDLKKLKYFNE